MNEDKSSLGDRQLTFDLRRGESGEFDDFDEFKGKRVHSDDPRPRVLMSGRLGVPT
jgi:hypothetical protein